ncbi:alpha/beta hydrolase [Kribbella sp. NBC_00382]|uniref:alpha/beta fold hydrolase n=1 Tax=Kribbella sp. NBC_00382 TaxID=2975967 RepID=UPI002E1F41EE
MTQTLKVPGAELYYEVRGHGPLLLIGQSGDGDADRSADLVGQLTDHFTVVSYDRRGLSRSPLTDPNQPVTPEMHADDMHRLLAALTDEAAVVLGCSIGALLGLQLAADHPEQVSVLIAHDPATPGLLPAADRVRIEQTLADIQAAYRQDGLPAALRLLAEATGITIDAMAREPQVVLQPTTAARVANMDFFLTNDLSRLSENALDAETVVRAVASGVRIIAAAGEASHAAWNYQCAEILAGLVGSEVVEFPGGHNGNTMFPRAFAARLLDVLQRERLVRAGDAVGG